MRWENSSIIKKTHYQWHWDYGSNATVIQNCTEYIGLAFSSNFSYKFIPHTTFNLKYPLQIYHHCQGNTVSTLSHGNRLYLSQKKHFSRVLSFCVPSPATIPAIICGTKLEVFSDMVKNWCRCLSFLILTKLTHAYRDWFGNISCLIIAHSIYYPIIDNFLLLSNHQEFI